MNAFSRRAAAVAVLSFFFATGILQAQENPPSDGASTGFLISFVPGLSFPWSPEDRVKLAIGVLISDVKILDGVQVSSLINMASSVEHGVQAAGIMNLVSGEVSGIMASGVINLSGRMSGVQTAGVANISEDFDGIQVSGVANIADNLNGAQISGVINVADDVKGVTVSLVNLAQALDGASIGLVNINSGLKGTMIGLLNITGKADGPMIGLINISEDGIMETTFTYDAAGIAYLGYKTGSKVFFTHLMAGTNIEMATSNVVNYISGATAGTRLGSDFLHVDLEAGLLSGNLGFDYAGLFLTGRGSAGLSFGKNIGIFAGFSVNTASLVAVTDVYPICPETSRIDLPLPWGGGLELYPEWFLGFSL